MKRSIIGEPSIMQKLIDQRKLNHVVSGRTTIESQRRDSTSKVDTISVSKRRISVNSCINRKRIVIGKSKPGVKFAADPDQHTNYDATSELPHQKSIQHSSRNLNESSSHTMNIDENLRHLYKVLQPLDAQPKDIDNIRSSTLYTDVSRNK